MKGIYAAVAVEVADQEAVLRRNPACTLPEAVTQKIEIYPALFKADKLYAVAIQVHQQRIDRFTVRIGEIHRIWRDDWREIWQAIQWWKNRWLWIATAWPRWIRSAGTSAASGPTASGPTASGPTASATFISIPDSHLSICKNELLDMPNEIHTVRPGLVSDLQHAVLQVFPLIFLLQTAIHGLVKSGTAIDVVIASKTHQDIVAAAAINRIASGITGTAPTQHEQILDIVSERIVNVGIDPVACATGVNDLIADAVDDVYVVPTTSVQNVVTRTAGQDVIT